MHCYDRFSFIIFILSPQLAADCWRIPLHLAVQNGNKEVVKVLLERGANNTKLNKAGHTPLSLALHYGHRKVAEIIQLHDAIAMNSYTARRSPSLDNFSRCKRH